MYKKVLLDLKNCRERYSDYLKNKRVVIIGPAPSILNSKQKDFIEGFDVIVRLNKALPIPNDLIEDIGSRTDVLYNCMNPSPECGGIIDIDLLHKSNVKFLVSPYSKYKDYRFGKDVEDFASRNLMYKTPINFCHIDPTLFARLMEIMKLPNTGVNAIIDVLQNDIKELYITGLTFFKGGYIKQYRGYSEKQVLDRMAKYNLHDQDKQLAYMRKLLKNNPRVKLDSALHDIIYDIPTHNVQIDPSLVITSDIIIEQNIEYVDKPYTTILRTINKTPLILNSPVDKPVDKPVAKLVDKPVVKPVDKPSISLKKPVAKPAKPNTQVKKSVKNSKPVDKPKPIVKTEPNAKKSFDKLVNKPSDKSKTTKKTESKVI